MVYLPLWKIWKSVDVSWDDFPFPIYGKKHLPNHQPATQPYSTNGFIPHFISPDGDFRAKAKLTKLQRTAMCRRNQGPLDQQLQWCVSAGCLLDNLAKNDMLNLPENFGRNLLFLFRWRLLGSWKWLKDVEGTRTAGNPCELRAKKNMVSVDIVFPSKTNSLRGLLTWRSGPRATCKTLRASMLCWNMLKPARNITILKRIRYLGLKHESILISTLLLAYGNSMDSIFDWCIAMLFSQVYVRCLLLHLHVVFLLVFLVKEIAVNTCR